MALRWTLGASFWTTSEQGYTAADREGLSVAASDRAEFQQSRAELDWQSTCCHVPG